MSFTYIWHKLIKAMKYYQLSTFIKAYSQLPKSEIQRITSKFCFLNMKERDILSEEYTSGKLFFVNKGIIRAFCIAENEEIITRMIAWENRMLTNIIHFEKHNKTPEYIECIKDAEILYITQKDLSELMASSPVFVEIFFKILESHMLRYVEKARYVSGSTRMKMEYFKQHYSPLIGKIGNGIIASFLGISREHLVRNKKYW